MAATVGVGDRTLLQWRAAREAMADGFFTSENALRMWWKRAMSESGMSQFVEVARAHATATEKKGMEGDGLTGHFRDATTQLLGTKTIRFAGAKQVGMVLTVLQKQTKRTLVIGVGHLASGLSVKKEEQRALQMTELCELVKTEAAACGAFASFVVGDCNASPYAVDADDGSTIPPLAVKAAEAAGFVLQVPKSKHPEGSAEYVAEMRTSSKIRDVSGRVADDESGAPALKRPRKIQKKVALNDLVFQLAPDGKPAIPLQAYLMPCADAPPNKVSGMETNESDHLLLQLEFGAVPGIIFRLSFWNLLAHGLDEEMCGHVEPCIAPGDGEAARAALAACAETPDVFEYDIGEPSEYLAAPYPFPEELAGDGLGVAVDAAWERSVRLEAAKLSKTYADVVKSRQRAWRRV